MMCGIINTNYGKWNCHKKINTSLPGPYIAEGGVGGRWGSGPRQENSFIFSNIVFEIAELFLVAILVRNHKKID